MMKITVPITYSISKYAEYVSVVGTRSGRAVVKRYSLSYCQSASVDYKLTYLYDRIVYEFTGKFILYKGYVYRSSSYSTSQETVLRLSLNNSETIHKFKQLLDYTFDVKRN